MDKKPSVINRIILNEATFSHLEIQPTKYNFFYGNNGTGKSTIANAIKNKRMLEWNKEESEYEIVVFNQDYIHRNFMDYGTIQGVYLFGKRDIEMQQKIDALTLEKKKKEEAREIALNEYTTKKNQLNSLLTDFQDTCFKMTAILRKKYEKALVGKKVKRTFCEAILKETMPIEQDILHLDLMYNVAFGEDIEMYNEFVFVDRFNFDDSNVLNDLLNKMILSSMDSPFSNFIKALGNSASDWILNGHTHYENTANGKCPYCQQVLPSSFEKDIASCFDEEYKKEISVLKVLGNKYIEYTRYNISSLKNNMEFIHPSIDLEDYINLLDLLEGKFEMNVQRIEQKIKEPSISLTLEPVDSLIDKINLCIESINEVIQEHNEIVKERDKSKRRCTKELIQHLSYILYSQVDNYKQNEIQLNKEMKQIVNRGQNLRKDIHDLSMKITSLNAKNVSNESVIYNMNQFLKTTGFQGFSIQLKDKENNLYQLVREDGSIVQQLSEGERNFLAFLYFYQEVQGSIKKDEFKNKIVVIDDPVSGMDSITLSITSEIGKKIIQDKNVAQLFVLTHNTNFFEKITRKLEKDTKNVSFYTIQKINNQSFVKECIKEVSKNEFQNYNPIQNSYTALWNELKEVQSPISTINVMRRIINTYFIDICGYDYEDLPQHLISLFDGNEVVEREDITLYKESFKEIFKQMGHLQHYINRME